MNQMQQINPLSFIEAMSAALELTDTGISSHHKSTAIIANTIGVHLKLSDTDLHNLVFASLLHDIGASSNWTEKHFIAHSDVGDEVFHHAEEGYQLIRKSPQLGHIAEYIRHHHDKFDGGNPSGLVGEEIPLLSRIIHLADRIDVLIDKNTYIFKQRTYIIDFIKKSKHFDPQLVEAFLLVSKRESFWLNVVSTDHNPNFLGDMNYFAKMSFNINDMITIAEIFASIVDSTSSYTAKHSRNVALVAEYIAQKSSYGYCEAKQFYLAGLLHDLGKLAVPNEILNKPGPLTESEFDVIKQHPYYSRLILEKVNGFESIAQWIGEHHESFDGRGYPDKLEKDSISYGARLLQTADVFSSLIEKRPYRSNYSLEEALRIMNKMANDKKLDPFFVAQITPYSEELITLIQQTI